MSFGHGLRSRLAPTPSGYLHLGNAVNFLLTWLLVRRAGGVLKLRIDDADAGRSRPEYVADIFRQLEWLGLDWDEGPSGPDDFFARHSQLLRLERYREMLHELGRRTRLFPCACSRRQIGAQTGNGLYPGTCRATAFRPGRLGQPVRILVPEGCMVEVNGIRLDLAATLGDFILWRRDDLPAYQLASLTDDLDDRINLIVRGQDLLPSTAAQLFLADRLGETGFGRALFHHHPLLTGSRGEKLSKSDQALSLHAMRQAGAIPAEVYRAAARHLGIDPRAIATLADLLHAFIAAPPLPCAAGKIV